MPAVGAFELVGEVIRENKAPKYINKLIGKKLASNTK